VSLTTFAVAQLIRALPRVQLSRAVGALSEKSLPVWGARSVVSVYRTLYDVDLSEAENQGPYSSFDAFFTRELKPGARPIEDSVLVSPADGQLSSLGPIDGQGTILVKRQEYDVAELIGSAESALRYRGGEFAVVYLSPRDYHRVHSPVDGEVSSVLGIPGDLYPVNSVGEQHFDGLLLAELV
jgi:phosphatidylserine decarboxylase